MTLLVIGIALVGATSGAVFLQIDGIEGESLDQNHHGWIDVNGFNLGVSNSSGSSNDGTRSTVAANFQAVQVSKGIDKSTPALFLSAVNGQVYPNARLEVCTTGSTSDTNICFFEVGLKNVNVGSVGTSGTSDGQSQEAVSLNFEEITWTYSTLNPKDPKAAPTITSAGWDLLKNVPTSGK
jgi:type VI secretion system secreted protein Hcp